MCKENIDLFVDVLLFNDILMYNPYKQGIQISERSLFRKCFPGVSLGDLDFETAIVLVQKELLKFTTRDLYTVKEEDKIFFNDNKAAWVFSVLFDSDVVLDWFYPIPEQSKDLVQERYKDYCELGLNDFLDIFYKHAVTDESVELLFKLEIILQYLVYGSLKEGSRQFTTDKRISRKIL